MSTCITWKVEESTNWICVTSWREDVSLVSIQSKFRGKIHFLDRSNQPAKTKRKKYEHRNSEVIRKVRKMSIYFQTRCKVRKRATYGRLLLERAEINFLFYIRETISSWLYVRPDNFYRTKFQTRQISILISRQKPLRQIVTLNVDK